MLEAVEKLQKHLYEAYNQSSAAIPVSDWGQGVELGRAEAYLDAITRLEAIIMEAHQSAVPASP